MMKKVMYVVLAVLMILPVIVSCSSAPEGNPVTVNNFQVISYESAFDEAGNKDESLAVSLFSGVATAYVPEGETMTLKHVMEGFIYDNGVDSVLNDAGTMYESFYGYAGGNGFFWNYYVNGQEASLSTEVKPEDTIKVVYEK